MMNNKTTVGALYPHRIHPIQGKAISPRTNASQRTTDGTTFQQILQQQVDRLKFSQHAQHRLQQRGISLSDSEIAQIESAVQKAAAKGAKDSLIMMNQVALIVNVPNKTVVTAVDHESMKDHVFTQIDSAVLIGAGP